MSHCSKGRRTPVRLNAAALAAVAFLAQHARADYQVPDTYPLPSSGTTNSISVSSTTVRSAADQMLMGWNILTAGMQSSNPAASPVKSNLWVPANSSTGAWPAGGGINPALVSFLSDDFRGAAYRYGSNVMDWRKAVGSTRPYQRPEESWMYTSVQFGPEEFLRFVEQVKGEPMLILNMTTFKGNSISHLSDAPKPGGVCTSNPSVDANCADWDHVKAEARAFFEYVLGCSETSYGTGTYSGNLHPCDLNQDHILQGNLRAANGHPEPYRVRHWELGNELDWDPGLRNDDPPNTPKGSGGCPTDDGLCHTLSPEVYARRARDLAAQLQVDWTTALGDNRNGSYLQGPNPVLVGQGMTFGAFNADRAFYLGSRYVPSTEPTELATNDPQVSPYSPQSYWLKQLWNTAGTKLRGMSSHQYYEGYPLHWFLRASDVYGNQMGHWASLGGFAAPGVYVTETAKWPDYNSIFENDPDKHYRETAKSTTAIDGAQAGALVSTNYLIGLASYPKTKMALRFDISNGEGWWAPFSPLQSEYIPAGGGYQARTVEVYKVGTDFTPRPLAWAAKLMHRALRDMDLKSTSIATTNASNWGYDIRGVGYARSGTDTQGALLVHHASARTPVALTLPGWTQGNWVVRLNGVHNLPAGQTPTLWRRYAAVDVDASKQATVRVPGLSVVDARALTPNLLLNGNFDTNTNGWSSTGCSSVTRTSDTTDAIDGTWVLRLNRSSGTCRITQGSGTGGNAYFGTSASPNLGTSPQDTVVVRAQVRGSAVTAANVSLNLQVSGINNYGYPDLALANGKETAGQGWIPIELEFIPGVILGTTAYSGAQLMLSSTASSIDVDGITVIRRKNLVVAPKLGVGSTPDAAWEQRVYNGGLISFHGINNNVPQYFSLSRPSAAASTQLVQNNNNPTTGVLGAGQLIDTGRNDKWRLKARVRYTSLNGAAPNRGARLKVQMFDGSGAYYDASPQGELYTGSNGWKDVSLDFVPADVITAKRGFSRAELVFQIDDTTGGSSFDVTYVGLERVLD